MRVVKQEVESELHKNLCLSQTGAFLSAKQI